MSSAELFELPAPVSPTSNGLSVGGEIITRGAALQQVRTSYATAIEVQKARVIQDVRRRLEDEAALAGEDFYYGWGAGKDSIEGPSVKLALAAARCWGNCAIELAPVQETSDAWIFTANFVDLETGFTLPRQFRQSKRWTVHGKFDAERKDDIRFQLGQSKAIRNVILNALPSSLVTRAMAKAKQGVRAKIENFINEKGIRAAVDLVLRALAKHGVKEEMVTAKLGIARSDAIGVDELVLLKGDLAALEQGAEAVSTLYPIGGSRGPAATPTPGRQSLRTGNGQDPPASTPASAPAVEEKPAEQPPVEVVPAPTSVSSEPASVKAPVDELDMMGIQDEIDDIKSSIDTMNDLLEFDNLMSRLERLQKPLGASFTPLQNALLEKRALIQRKGRKR